jgi:hypothetical protein
LSVELPGSQDHITSGVTLSERIDFSESMGIDEGRASTHPPPRPACLVGQVLVSERRIVVVRVVQRVDPVRAEHVSFSDGFVAPPVVGLAGELEDRHDTVTGIPASASSDMSGYVILAVTE